MSESEEAGLVLALWAALWAVEGAAGLAGIAGCTLPKLAFASAVVVAIDSWIIRHRRGQPCR